MDVNEPSIMKLELKPRTQEVILETKAEHINEDFSHEDLVGAIYTEGDLRGSDFRGSDLRAAIFSRAIMPGVNLEGADMSNSFLDYVVLRGSNMRGVIAREANFVRSDLGDCDVTNADFTEAVIDRYQAINLMRQRVWDEPVHGGGHEGFTRVRAVKALRGVQQGELQGGGVQGLGDVGRRGEW